ncbi:hypothetical protein FRX31_023781 [Thalictrum thalictroides]|uniref:RNase H type-1 domain-containing protein n=1 Tax=Thalictrum thalictroides TaxID=46969 RepID=A0A7J6VQJ3_THATH|nr:hypothetical protein FRX31_023781 [Thalictrum thalictroides]
MWISHSFLPQLIGIGYILRSSNGAFILAGNQCGNTATAESTKCQGILTAAGWAINQQLKVFEIETDCQSAADYLNGAQNSLSWSGNYSVHILAQHADRSLVVPKSFSESP